MSDFPTRKQNRLKYYDYSKPGAYFITICTENRRCILGRPVNTVFVGEGNALPKTEIMLSAYGETVRSAIIEIPKHYDSIAVDSYVIMPNHVHIILILLPSDGRQVAAPTVSTVISQMKAYVSRQIGHTLWQKSFYDRIIKDRDSYRRIRKYILQNPLIWEFDRYYTPQKF